VLENGVCTLWSRTQKRILSLPHIERAVEAHFGSLTEYKKTRLILDGEAYNHDLHDQFEELMSAFRKDKPSAESAMLEYHIYDVVPNKSYLFSDRNEWLSEVLPTRDGVLVPVRTVVCHSNEEIWDAHAQNVTEGYEGSMIRVDGPYECGKRSAYLRKLKAFQDAEYKIVGAVEGRGKDAGTIGSFVCVTPEGREFGCRLKSTYARRAELFLNPKEWKDQLLTVKYQNLTADGIPRFPIGKALREGA
jgi:ATP-dependent DNA ligase